MLTKYAVQLLVATTYVLASPPAPATNDVKNTVPALLRPEEDANTIAESLLGKSTNFRRIRLLMLTKK